MWFYFSIALKNVFRQKKRSFTLGINYAVVTFILVLLFAFSQGAIRNITTNLVRSSAGHITVSGSYTAAGRVYLGVRRYPEATAAVRQVFGGEARAIPRYVVRSDMYYGGISKRLDFTGVDTALDAGLQGQLRFISGSWQQFAATDNGMILPKDVAEYFGLSLDDEVVIASRTRFGAFNTGTLKLKGIYESGNYFVQGLVLCRFPFIQGLDLAEKDTASTLYLYFPEATGLDQKRALLSAELRRRGFEVDKPASASAAIDAVSSASPTYKVDASGADSMRLTLSTIDEAVGIVKIITSAVNAVGGIVALVMLFIIAVSIFINLRMSINERLREIGTMRTIGLGAGGITSLFILENVILSLLFCVAGVAAALIVAGIFALLVTLPSTGALALFLDRGHLVLIPRFGDIAAVVALIAAFTALFSFFPARHGGRITPVDALTRVF
jgi:ABC-type lipoprotein release transport system permease subunit